MRSLGLIGITPCFAQTTTYSYDAQGRLTAVDDSVIGDITMIMTTPETSLTGRLGQEAEAQIHPRHAHHPMLLLYLTSIMPPKQAKLTWRLACSLRIFLYMAIK